MYIKTWGDECRTEFAQVGELRSPAGVNVMALTATTTTDTFTIISQRLSMFDPVVVALPPNRDNITYQVHEKVDLDELATAVCHDLNARRMCFPKTIIYVRTYTISINMYLAIKMKISKHRHRSTYYKARCIYIVRLAPSELQMT